MRTKSQTTYILLDRGTEDVQLRDELLKIQAKVAKNYKSTKEYYKTFPKFIELLQGLTFEIRAEEKED